MISLRIIILHDEILVIIKRVHTTVVCNIGKIRLFPMKDKCKWFKFILVVHLFWILHPRTDKAGHQNNYIFMLISQYCTFLLVMQCSVMCHTFSFEDFFPNINILTSPCDIVSCDLICSELPHLDVWPPKNIFFELHLWWMATKKSVVNWSWKKAFT